MKPANSAAAYPAILDVTKETIAEYPGMHVIRDTSGRVIALCPLYEEKVCEDQFSFAPIVHRALNGMANGIEDAARFIETHEVLDGSDGQTLRKRSQGNRAGLAYSQALRSLSIKAPSPVLQERPYRIDPALPAWDVVPNAERIIASLPDGQREIIARRLMPNPSSEPIRCYVAEMKTSAGADYFVTVRCGEREITPHAHKIRSRAEYGVAEWNWLFHGGDKPDILAYQE